MQQHSYNAVRVSAVLEIGAIVLNVLYPNIGLNSIYLISIDQSASTGPIQ